jgi:hypothetical protein
MNEQDLLISMFTIAVLTYRYVRWANEKGDGQTEQRQLQATMEKRRAVTLGWAGS